YFGRLNASYHYGKQVDGLGAKSWNPDSKGKPVKAFHEKSLCTGDINHNWNAMHGEWNRGRNDGFVTVNGASAMAYHDEDELPYYYALADEYAIGDRYFASVMTQTYPNRMYLFAATSMGHIKNDMPKTGDQFNQKTIFDLLSDHGVSWKYYPTDEDYLKIFGPSHKRGLKNVAKDADFKTDLAEGKLPQVTFLESSEELGQDEHPPSNIQIGQAWVGERLDALMKSKYWEKTAVFFVYDEAGGYFDHVAPPEACAPDDVAPLLGQGNLPGGFDRYGFRVPFLAISPYAKRHYVSHVTYDHTSILKFIETKFNLPALTRRDANAVAPLDLFDFAKPPKHQKLPSYAVDPARAKLCKKD
ncbi:MAG: alkaline phosphatase family protein, partial [Deltaproteobacteria bacterium]|nr:alkaline phosphatase family protein [Deltaproteobacteria bacterium]